MDLTLAVRMLIRHPALSAIAVFGITVGIAIAATMFTLVGEQLSPSDLPLPEGNRIVALQQWDSAKASRSRSCRGMSWRGGSSSRPCATSAPSER